MHKIILTHMLVYYTVIETGFNKIINEEGE